MKWPHRSITRSTISRCVLVEVRVVLTEEIRHWDGLLSFKSQARPSIYPLFLLSEDTDRYRAPSYFSSTMSVCVLLCFNP